MKFSCLTPRAGTNISETRNEEASSEKTSTVILRCQVDICSPLQGGSLRMLMYGCFRLILMSQMSRPNDEQISCSIFLENDASLDFCTSSQMLNES